MKKTTLLLKGRWRTALLVLALSVVGMGNLSAQTQFFSFDFSEVCPTGQELWYKITDETNRYVEVVAPAKGRWETDYNGNHIPFWQDFWVGYSKPTGEVVIPEQVRGYTVVGLSGITFYDHVSGSFEGCVGLVSVVIPNTVTSIGTCAFYGCTGLTSIDIPNSVTLIGLYAFSGCTGLTSVTIPNSVVTIGDKAFEGCTGLVKVNFDAINCTYMGIYSQSGNNKNKTVFYGCTALSTLNIGEQVQTIPDYAFYGCSYLTGNLIIPNSVTTIGGEAFKGCSGFASLTIGNAVASIGLDAFKGCYNIASLNYNAMNCTSNGSSSSPVFDCSSLTDLTIGENVQTIPAYAFKGCNKVTNLIIPNSVTSIGSNAFSGFSGTFITIPKSVASIGSSAFGNCARLTTVYYNAENAVASNVFCSYQNGNWVNSCPNLTTIHIGADVQEIGDNVFKGCDGVHLVVAMGPTPVTLVGGAFTDFADNSILMVSCGKRMTYFSVWNMFEFNNIMEDCNTYPVSMGNVGAGGSISASTTNAQMGEVVDLTVSPNAGMVLSSISVFNASDPTQTIPVMPVGKATSMYRFVMPPFGVSVTATFVAGTSVGENGSVPASVYPNPTNSQIKIEAESLKHITIGNMLGQTIYEGKAYGDRFENDFGKHGAGFYLVRIETANGVAVRKVSVTQ